MDRQVLARFDLNLIKVFLSIWECRSLTGAGKVLGLTQPAVSHALRRLRETFGDPLFQRVGNRMDPTETAARLQAPLSEALLLLGRALDQTHGFDPATSARSFRIVLTDTGEFVVLPALLSLIANEAPQVSVQTVKAPPAEIEATLRSGRADMAIGYQPLLEKSACLGTLLQRDRLVCLLRAGHPALKRSWTAETFAALGFLDVSADATGYRMARDTLAELGLSHRLVARLEHFTILPEVIRRTDHAALFPYSVLQRMQPATGLDMREIPVPIPHYEIRVWVHRQFAEDPGIEWLRKAVARALPVTPAPP
jgi:DNA-binding transcriptional LysR family regulator